MDVTKTTMAGTGAAAASAPPAADQGPKARTNTAPLADRADIRGLDIPAALQILLAEVRAAFDTDMDTIADSPSQAAHTLVRMVLQTLPDEAAAAPVWSDALARVEAALQSGLDRGVSAISAWRDVPAAVVDAAQGARTLVLAVLGEDPHNPVWLRPEWAGLAPRLERFWRRRRRWRRNLSDPDYPAGNLDDGPEQRS